MLPPDVNKPVEDVQGAAKLPANPLLPRELALRAVTAYTGVLVGIHASDVGPWPFGGHFRDGQKSRARWEMQ